MTAGGGARDGTETDARDGGAGRTVPHRPYVLVSCAVSVDGRIDDAADRRLVLSNPADLDRVDGLRAGVDAILVGANTVRRDNPGLLIRSQDRRAARVAAGLPAHPLRVTVTGSGRLDPAARFFAGQDPGHPAPWPLVYCASPVATAAAATFGRVAEVVDAGDPLSLESVFGHLVTQHSVARVLVEGGAAVLRHVLTAGLADELHLAVAPFFVGQRAAPSFALPGAYPHGDNNPMTLAEVGRLGGMVVLRYLLGPGGADRRYLRAAIEESRRCPPSPRAFSVGAVVVGADGAVLASGHSREQGAHDHAEEVALRKLAPGDPRLAEATIYSSLEPCGARASRPVTCVRRILAAGIRRVVFAWREPPLFADGGGAEQLREAGVTVVEMPDLAGPARGVNAHLRPK